MSIEELQTKSEGYKKLWDLNYNGFRNETVFELCRESVKDMMNSNVLNYRAFEDLGHMKSFTKIAFLVLQKDKDVFGEKTLNYLGRIHDLNLEGAEKTDQKGGYSFADNNKDRISPKYKLAIHFMEHAATIADMALSYCIDNKLPDYVKSYWFKKAFVARDASMYTITSDLKSYNLHFDNNKPTLNYAIFDEMLSIVRRHEESMYNFMMEYCNNRSLPQKDFESSLDSYFGINQMRIDLLGNLHSRILIDVSGNLSEAESLIIEQYETKLRGVKFANQLWDMFNINFKAKFPSDSDLDKASTFRLITYNAIREHGEFLLMPLTSTAYGIDDMLAQAFKDSTKFIRKLTNAIPTKPGSIPNKLFRQTAYEISQDNIDLMMSMEESYRDGPWYSGQSFKKSPYLNLEVFNALVDLDKRLKAYREQ